MRSLPLIVLLLAALAATTAAAPPLTVTPGSSLYEPGDLVVLRIAGSPGAIVGVEVRGPKGELVILKQVVLNASGVAVVAFTLSPYAREGVYTAYVATPGAMVKATFTVVMRPPVILVLAPPGVVRVGGEAIVYCFAYPGIELKLAAYVRPPGGGWEPIGEYETISSGGAAFRIRPEAEGTYEVKVVDIGSREYAPASAPVSFKATASPHTRCRVEAPPTAWLNDTIVINCSGCDSVLARTIAGDRSYACGESVVLDVPGPWVLYPVKGGVAGAPTIVMVRARLTTKLVGPSEAGVGEPITLRAVLTPAVPGVKVRFVEEGGEALGEAVSRSNGTAWAAVAFKAPGDYVVRAVPQPTSVIVASPSDPLTIRVLGERVYVRIIVVDAASRRLYNSVVEVGGARFEAPMGVAEAVVRAGDYDVRVLWRGLTVYSGRLRLEGGNVTVKAELYDLKVRVVDFTGSVVAGEYVELLNNSRIIARIRTNERGVATFIRVPPGEYVVKCGDASAPVAVPEESEVELRLPPPSWLPVLAVIAVAIVAALIAFRVFGKKRPSKC
ncbi:MAG: hypothetical protein DRK00_06285 [Thermoprotei archaeon]|nr:MAG: hypothetical protein DRK00_06285 [Thermoprotei archaeon]